MKQKWWSLGTTFIIKDEAGDDRFVASSKLLSLGNNLSFTDMHGHELAAIHEKLLPLSNTYEIYHGGSLYAVVKEGWLTLLSYRFSVDVDSHGTGPGALQIKGDFAGHEYTFTAGGQPVASVSRAWFSLVDTYGVDITDTIDDVLILACTVVVDLCTQKHKSGR